jgi:predicted protein tyrosine phosphatase
LDLAELVVEGPRVNIAIASREIAERYTCRMTHAVLSITDPGMGLARLADNSNRLGLLRLSFDDVVPDLGYSGNSIRVFDESHADAAAEFVSAHLGTTELLVVHCEKGRSRSAGVAAAVSRWQNGDDAEFFARYEPNRHVYEVMLRRLERTSAESATLLRE